MADDNTIYPRFGRQKWHRRKRSVQGKDWAPANKLAVHRGVWCPKCQDRHPYNGKGKLVTTYEKRPDGWHTYWHCPVTLDQIGELEVKGVTEDQGDEDGHDNGNTPDGLLPGNDS